jgi:hypothetical protein
MRKTLLTFLYIFLCALFAIGQNPGGSKFFPIAVWLQSAENAMSYKQNGGINMYVGLWNQLDKKQFDLLKKADIKLICEQNDFGLAHKTDQTIFGWMHGDEPDNAQWNNKTQTYDPCITPDEIITYYEKIKEKDPEHPFYLNLGQGVTYINWVGRGECKGRTDMYSIANNGYLKGCDIASFDVYPVNSDDPNIQNNLWMGAKGIDSMKVWSNSSKPIWTWIETTRIEKDSHRKPTVNEVKTQVWMALIHGAKGIGYFCHSFYPDSDEAALLHDRTMLAGVKEINNQISSLASILKSSNSTVQAVVKSSNSNVPIDIMTKFYENSTYVFAVAMRNEPTNGTFKVHSGEDVEVIGENRKLKISNEQFEDQFGGYDVHLYKINVIGTIH